MLTGIARLEYTSLAELYRHYVREYVARSPIVASCGCVIHCYEHHFVHMVKLCGPRQERLYFPDEKPIILATTEGFGKYEHDALRGRRLLYTLEALRNPDEVVRPKILRTADRAFIKEFDRAAAPYQFTVVLVRKDEASLTLCTGQPVRRTDVKKWRDGDLLWPKNTSATLAGG